MKWLIKLVLPQVIDMLIEALDKLSRKSTNTIDDGMVSMVRDNKEIIVEQIREQL